MIFVLISIFEMSRAMWNYHTLAYAMREGTRYAVVHGANCSTDPLNSCQVTVGQIARKIQNAGVGLDAGQLNLTFTSSGATIACTLSACLSDATPWPAGPNNIPGRALAISGSVPFQTALAMFWPGAGAGANYGLFNFTAGSADIIQF
jgi:hypothetical protein